MRHLFPAHFETKDVHSCVDPHFLYEAADTVSFVVHCGGLAIVRPLARNLERIRVRYTYSSDRLGSAKYRFQLTGFLDLQSLDPAKRK